MLRRLRLLFNPSGERNSPFAEAQGDFNHFVEPRDAGEQISSVNEAFTRIGSLAETLRDSDAVGRPEKRLIRRSLPELEDLRDLHSSQVSAAEKIEGQDRRRAAVFESDGFVFEALAFYGTQLSGVADHYADRDATGALEKTAQGARLLWQTLSNSAVSSRVAAFHAAGGIDHVLSETGMPIDEAKERLSEWPGTGFGGEWVDQKSEKPKRAHVGGKHTHSFAPGKGSISTERNDAIKTYGHMTPSRDQLVSALRSDLSKALTDELDATSDPKRHSQITGAMKAVSKLNQKDPISHGGVLAAERLVENGLVRDQQARKRLLGLAFLAQRHETREAAFISRRVDMWDPDNAPSSDIAQRAHNVHQGVIDRLRDTSSPQGRAVLAGISRFLDNHRSETMDLGLSLKITKKLSDLVHPGDGKSLVALRVAEQATSKATEKVHRQTRDKARSVL